MSEKRPSLNRALQLPGPAPSRVVVYAEAVAAVAVALSASYLLAESIGATRLLLLWVMSAYVAWGGGFRPVAFASVLGALLWDFFLREPTGQFSLITGQEMLSVAVYLVVSMIMGRTFDSLRAERQRYRALIEASTVMVWSSDA